MTELAYDTLRFCYETWSLTSPVMDSVSVIDILTDQGRVTHCGTVLLCNAGGKSPNTPSLLIPRPRRANRGEVETEEEMFTVCGENMIKVEHGSWEGLGLVCFFLDSVEESTGNRKTRLFVVLEIDQLEIFQNQLPSLFSSKIPILRRARTELTSLIMSNNNLNRFDKAKAMKQQETHYSVFRDYIRPYIYFSKYWPVKEKMKERLFHCRNLPMLLKKMKFSDQLIEKALCDFIRLHKCRNKHCEGFCTNKCSGCKFVRYCDYNCQEMDFSKHSKLCQKMKKEKEKAFYVGIILQKELQARMDESKLYSLEFFISNVLTRVFQAFSDHLNETFIQTKVLKHLRKHNIERIDWEKLDSILSDQRRGVTLCKLRLQMVQQYGQNNFLTESEGEASQVGAMAQAKKHLAVIKKYSSLHYAYSILILAWVLLKIYKLSLGLPFSSWW